MSHKSVDQTESLMNGAAGSLESHREFLPQRGQRLKWEQPSRGNTLTRKTSVLVARFWIRVMDRRLKTAGCTPFPLLVQPREEELLLDGSPSVAGLSLQPTAKQP